jgi:polyphosphate kinase
MHALIEAAKAGKQVLAVIEIRARFDETANLRWAQALEEAGAHVVYGILGFKTHAKASLVVREENGVLRRYCHVGTGNYHPKTARLYEDFGLLSADEELGRDLGTLFNQLSGLSPDAQYQRLLVAPKFLRSGIIERINRETSNHLAGLPSRIRFKVNSIIDREIIRALYRAANAGVPVELNTRGICSFSNRSIEFSSRVKVKSILGRFLEHSRIYNFHNNGDEEYWIGSADMMDRNLNRRIETLVRIDNMEHKESLNAILAQIFSGEFESWSLNESDLWIHDVLDSSGHRLPNFQEHQIREITE